MKSVTAFPYLNPKGLARPIPLERFLPECPVGVVRQYLDENGLAKNWVMDPFGSNPLAALEIAESGRKVLIACNNPVLMFALQLLAKHPDRLSFLDVLAELASQSKGEERLEGHIKSLYQTQCAVCRNAVQANGYLWRRGDPLPFAKIYKCGSCGDEGEREITEADIQILQPLLRGEPIHLARAIHRVLHGQNEDRAAVENVLKIYTPRALYVLFTLLNKLEGMNLPPERKILADAMMISLLDAGTSLTSWPLHAEQPRQLTLPQVYIEKNLWTELENCIPLWTQPGNSIDVYLWPEIPEQSGICIFPGPVRNLESLHLDIQIKGLICLPPRPNQAFWTLSALWSAWLWSADQNSSFTQVLGRRRFDWHWHTLALHQAFAKAANLCPESLAVFTLIGEPSPGMVYSTFSSMYMAGYSLKGLSLKGESMPIQTGWLTREKEISSSRPNLQSVIRESIRSTLLNQGEPLDYLSLYAAVTAHLAANGAFPKTINEFTLEKSSEMQGLIAHVFSDEEFLCRYDATAQEFESGKWGLADWTGSQPPISDQLEDRILGLFTENSMLKADNLSSLINKQFPGLLTPSSGLIEFTLQAYADWDSQSESWKIREKESPQKREEDLRNIVDALSRIGEKLGYETQTDFPIKWREKGKTIYRFFTSNTAKVNEVMQITGEEDPETESVYVFPGSRSALLKFKLLSNPRLRILSEENRWHLLKFRAVDSFIELNNFNRELWKMHLDSDPINLEEAAQLRMFG